MLLPKVQTTALTSRCVRVSETASSSTRSSQHCHDDTGATVCWQTTDVSDISLVSRAHNREQALNKTLRAALIAFVAVGLISFVLSFVMTALGAHPRFEVIVIAMGITLPVFVIFWNLSGNRKVWVADAGQRAQALSFAPPAGRALIYCIRTGFLAKAAGMNISIDGRECAQIKAPQFTCVEVLPGMHTIEAALGGGAGAQSNTQSTDVIVQAGETAALLLTVKMGGMKGSVSIENIPTEQAKGLIANMKMVAPDATGASS
jgi:hypothetical protein